MLQVNTRIQQARSGPSLDVLESKHSMVRDLTSAIWFGIRLTGAIWSGPRREARSGSFSDVWNPVPYSGYMLHVEAQL